MEWCCEIQLKLCITPITNCRIKAAIFYDLCWTCPLTPRQSTGQWYMYAGNMITGIHTHTHTIACIVCVRVINCQSLAAESRLWSCIWFYAGLVSSHRQSTGTLRWLVSCALCSHTVHVRVINCQSLAAESRLWSCIWFYAGLVSSHRQSTGTLRWLVSCALCSHTVHVRVIITVYRSNH